MFKHPAVPDEPRIVRAYCSEVVWGPPTNPNGRIIGYQLLFIHRNGDEVVQEVITNKGADEYFHEVIGLGGQPTEASSSNLQVYVQVMK